MYCYELQFKTDCHPHWFPHLSSPVDTGQWTLGIGFIGHWTLEGRNLEILVMVQVGLIHCGLCWTLIILKFQIMKYTSLWLIWSWKSQYLLPIPVVLPGGEGNDRPTGKFNKTMRKKKQWINTVKTKDATGVYEVPR